MKPALIVAILFKSRGAIGGMAQRFALLADHLMSGGHPIEVLTTRSLLEHLRISPRPNMNVIEDTGGKVSGAGHLVSIGVLAKIVAGRYSRVHISGGGGLTMPVLKAAKISGTKSSVTFASRTLEMAGYDQPAQIEKWKKILDLADYVDVLNPGHNLTHWSGKISVSPGSFPSRYLEIPREVIERRDPLVVFCGAMEKTKNPILAIDAFSSYLDGNDVGGNLVLFGRGSLLEEVKARIDRLNSKSGCLAARLGTPGEYFSTLSRASVFLSLQEYDNYPSQSLMEAMAVGCNCIATADGDTASMFPEGGDNAVIASREPLDFAREIARSLERRCVSFANIDHIKKNHSIERFSGYFLDFLGVSGNA